MADFSSLEREAQMVSQTEKQRIVEERHRRIKENLASIKERVVVFSGKGGVGKTTVAVNMAYALMKRGNRVGLLDGDISGPNVPKMVGLTEMPFKNINKRDEPPTKDGVKIISLASIIPADSPVIWRGPMRSIALDQFLGDFYWGELDYLIADLPPGTGDEVMTLAQRMEPHIAIIVTTPQEMSLIDSRRAINMARKMGIEKIALVENMSGLRCPKCGQLIEVFSSGGGVRTARELKIPNLGSIPINLKARESADDGKPVILDDENADISLEMFRIADGVISLAADHHTKAHSLNMVS
jgi:Mrp family chromosome partitioning ATPase